MALGLKRNSELGLLAGKPSKRIMPGALGVTPITCRANSSEPREASLPEKPEPALEAPHTLPPPPKLRVSQFVKSRRWLFSLKASADPQSMPKKDSTKPRRSEVDIKMSFAQEMMNAFSMFIPVSVVYYHYTVAYAEPCFWTTITGPLGIAVGCLLHMPFAFMYHFLCALDFFEDRVENLGRKLDQTFIHVSSAIFSYALSGAQLYAVATALLHGVAISYIWKPPQINPGASSESSESASAGGGATQGTSGDALGSGTCTSADRAYGKVRRRNIYVGVLLYALPMAWRGDWDNFIYAWGGSWHGGALLMGMNPKLPGALRGWGHSLFHLACGFFIHFLVLSAAEVVEPICDGIGL